MKQEKNQKSKKWLWLILALVALLAVAGVVLALVLGGTQQEGPEGPAGGRPQLYWNVDRQQYIEEETGMSTRTKGEDGMYHVLFAYDGQQVELTVADKQIVNVIESMDVMGLAFDADGIVVDAVDPETVATKYADRFYVSKITDTAITLNSSYAMNGMEKELPITDMLGIYDVDPDAQVIGGDAEIGLMDEVLVYANDLNEPTHVYIVTRAPESEVYWRVARMYDSEKGMTTREPDENGVYTIQFACNGELVELKCKDKTLVTKIDSSAQLIGAFAFEFDEEGYIIDTVNVALSLRGKLLAQDYHVMEINGDQITIERIASGTDQGKRITFTLSEDCKIYQCCRNGCYDSHCGEPTDHLRLYDRIHVYSDLEGNPILIFVTIRQIDSPMYYNLKRMYSSANGGGTTREKEDGYYVFDMLEDGKQVTLRTKDKAIADAVDFPYNNCVGLELDGDIITRVYDAQCVSGYYSPGYRREVTSLTGGIFTLTKVEDSSVFVNCIMAENCKIYDVTGNPGVKKGSETTLQLGDRVIAWYDYAQKVNYIYVTDREVTTRAYCEYCKKTVVWEVAPTNGLGTIDTGKHLHYVVGQDTELTWGYGVLNKGTTLCLHLYGSTIEHVSRIFVVGGSKLNIMGSGGIVSSGSHKNDSLNTGNITVSNGEVNIYGGTIRSLSSKMPSININGKDAVVNLYGGSVIGGVDINVGTLNLGGKAKVLGAKGQLKDNIYVGTTGKLNVKADWSGEASVKFAIVSATGISKTFGTSEGAYTGKLYYESKGNPAVIGKDGGLVVVGEIIPDENDPDYRYCEHCGKRVMWSPAPTNGHGTLASGEHIHYYLTADFEQSWGYVVLQNKVNEDNTQSKTTVCLDLNGFDINQTGRIFVSGSELNIMGEGTVTTKAHKNATLNTGAVTVNSGTVNIYGGTYTSDNPDAPAILVNGNAAAVNLLGGKVIGGIRANDGKLVLGGDAAVTGTAGKNIYIGSEADLVVAGDWTGTAGVLFSHVSENPISNGSCTGAYTGKLTLEEDNGYSIIPQDGALYIPNYTIKAEVPIQPNFPTGVANGVTSEAWCEACQKNVTWTSASSGLSTRADGGHYHLFTSMSRDAGDPLTWQLGTVGENTTVCLYLNNTETVHNGRLFVLGGGTVNIMGKGTLTTNGTNASTSVLTGGITVNEGTVNVLGDIQLKSTNSAVPAVSVQYANAVINLRSGSVEGGIAVNNGKLALSGTATADSIALRNVGALNVSADWTGTADVTFKNLEENPVPNGTASGAFTGKLTTTIAGTKYDVVEQNGKLYISGYEGGAIPETPIAPNFPTNATNDTESEAWCEVCQKNVIWIAASSGLSTRSDGGHHHLFVSGSRTAANPLTWQLGTVTGETTVCLYLNDTETAHNGRLFVLGGSTVNIMGKGILTTNGTNTNADVLTGGITVNEGTVNVLGDIQLKSTNSAVPAVSVQYANAFVNLNDGAAVTGGVQVNNGKLTLTGSAAADTITVAEAGKLAVDESFTGAAKVTFASITENPVANGISTGAYTGKLTTTIDGTDYDIVAQDGKLLISGYTVPDSGDEEKPTDPTEPSEPTEPEEPVDDGLLHLDADGKAKCEHCGETVTWTGLTKAMGDKSDGAQYHLYLTKDISVGQWSFGSATKGTQICLHLNGFNITGGRRISVGNGTSVLSIMGKGTVTCDGTSENQTYVTGTLTAMSGTLNIYGGSYVSTAANGTPAIQVTGGTCTLGGDTTADSIVVSENGKLNVKADWTGTAKVTFASELVDGVVPAANGTSEGDFTGKLTTADGKKLIAKDGGLVIGDTGSDDEPVDDGLLHLDADSKAMCEHCGETVQWTELTGSLGELTTGTHHYYLARDWDSGYTMFSVNTSAQMCLHLNGKTLEFGRRIRAYNATTLNIMGAGAIIGTNANPGSNNQATIEVGWKATVNIYGGTYASTAEGVPTFLLNSSSATLNLLGGTVTDGITVTNGTLNLGGDTGVDSITVTEDGKLNVKADWTGTAKVTFASEPVDGVIPTANGTSEGDFTGALTTANGKKLIAKDGGLIVDGLLHLDADNKGYCEHCGETVTWTGLTKAMGDKSDGAQYHLYLTKDISVGQWSFGSATQGTQICLHLNGFNITGGRRISVGNATSVLSIMGSGTVTCDGTSANQTYVTGTLTAMSGALNIYGGSYVSTASNGTPAIQITGGTCTLGGDTTADSVVVAEKGKLNVKADWTGTAVATFAVEITDNKIPAANGTSEGAYGGELRLDSADGSRIVGENGGLVVKAAQDDGVLKILAIGNSFAVDSTTVLYEIYRAENPDKQVVIGVLNKGGASLTTHVSNLSNDTGAYYYHKLDSDIYASTGKWKVTNDTSIKTALLDENWDIVTMQQNSGNTTNAATYNDNIATIQDYVVQNLGYKPEFAWNFTWGYPDDEDLLNTSTDTSFAQNFFSNYGTTEAMYNKISLAVLEKIVNGTYSFDYLMPVGTAVQNARSNHLTAKDLYRDYAHLNNLGRFIAAYTWYCEFEGYNGTDKALTDLKLTQIPTSLALTSGVTELDAELEAIVIESVNNALKNKFAVTKVTE